MEQVFTALLNSGPAGVMAVALFMLHREALKAFREEMKEERDVNAAAIDKIVTKVSDKIDQVMLSRLSQDKRV